MAEKKRHHSSAGRGHMYKEHMGHHASGHYEGHVDRRRQEMEDAGMIREDHREIANLPQQVMMKQYPKSGGYMPEGLDDTIRGVDHQMGEDDNGVRKVFNPHKY